MASLYDDDEGVQQHEAPSFVLVPINSAARKAVTHVRNKYYQHQINDDTLGLYIGFGEPTRLEFTIGRRDADIYLPNDKGSKGSSPQISERQAAFRIAPKTGAVLLCDYSEHANTETFAPSNSSHVSVTVKFRSSNPKNKRTVLVARGINSQVAFGRDRYYQFELRWYTAGLYNFDSETPYTVGPRKSSIKKYIECERIGGGAFGEVWSALDITSGKLVAVKKFHNLTGKNLEFATREVANLFKINKSQVQHKHILQILDSSGGGREDNWGEIFMPLMMGSLRTLVETAESERSPDADIADTVLEQMLHALECIASHRIVHRDIKPENILWVPDKEAGYHFYLGDFGLSNDPNLARTVAGTEPFMAPEVFHRKQQSTKVDIWSLFATVVWVRNTDQFRQGCSQFGAPQIHRWLVNISTMAEYQNIRDMAQMQPKKRPSAKEQLAILCGGWTDAYGEDVDNDFAGSLPSSDGLLAEDLSEQFEKVCLADSGYGNGPESGESGGAPEVPYYEPYTTGLMECFPWEDQNDEGGPSRYRPPGTGDMPREHSQAYVAPYDRRPYGPPEDDDDSATAVPDTMWTTRPFMTEERPVFHDGDTKRKGKDRQYYRR